MLDRIDRVLEWWSRALLALAVLAGLAMMFHVSVDVFARTVLHAPLRQTNQMVAAYYMIAAAFLPIALLGKHDDHISADIFTAHMGPGLRRVLSAFTTFLGMAYMFVFTWQSLLSALRRTEQGEVLEISGGYMMVWPGRWLLPIAGASLFLCLTLRLLRLVLPGKAEPEHHPRIPDA
ncbi:MAG: TRAP transporter small permease [Oricola sp.]